MSTNNGGPAFPEYASDHRGAACNTTFSPKGGISMRDYFAAKAIQGLLANPGGPIQANGVIGWSWCNCSTEDVAYLAYSIADAMLKEREK